MRNKTKKYYDGINKAIKENKIKKAVLFHKTNDSDIIEYLESLNISNFNGYIKDLIRKEIIKKTNN